MPPIRYSRVVGKSKSYFMFLFSLCALALSGLVAAHFMDTDGHHVTGMTNRVVWGLPHVFLIFVSLILKTLDCTSHNDKTSPLFL